MSDKVQVLPIMLALSRAVHDSVDDQLFGKDYSIQLVVMIARFLGENWLTRILCDFSERGGLILELRQPTAYEVEGPR